jgi:hypothetical protein
MTTMKMGTIRLIFLIESLVFHDPPRVNVTL